MYAQEEKLERMFPRMFLMSRSINILIDSARENSARFLQAGRQLLLAFLTMVTHWSRSSCHFHALIAQNLTGGCTWKIYALSGNLLMIAEADSFMSSYSCTK